MAPSTGDIVIAPARAPVESDTHQKGQTETKEMARPTHLLLEAFLTSINTGGGRFTAKDSDTVTEDDADDAEDDPEILATSSFLRRLDLLRTTGGGLPRQHLTALSPKPDEHIHHLLKKAQQVDSSLSTVCTALRMTIEIAAAYLPHTAPTTISTTLHSISSLFSDLVVGRLLANDKMVGAAPTSGTDRTTILQTIINHLATHVQESKSVKELLGSGYMSMILAIALHSNLSSPPPQQMHVVRRQAAELLSDELLSNCPRNVDHLRKLCPPHQLQHIIHTLMHAGDFKLQSFLLELVFRAAPSDQDRRTQLANSIWQSKELATAFLAITSTNFTVGCRTLLNLVNARQASATQAASPIAPMVLSTPCVAITYNGIQLQSPLPGATGKKKMISPHGTMPNFWVDVNCWSITVDATVPGEDVVDLIEAPYAHIMRYDLVKGETMGGIAGSIILKLQLTKGVPSLKTVTPDFRQAVLVCECLPENPHQWIAAVRSIISEKKTARVSAPTVTPMPAPIMKALKQDGLASPFTSNKTMSPRGSSGFPAEQVFELFEKYSAKFHQPESSPPEVSTNKPSAQPAAPYHPKSAQASLLPVSVPAIPKQKDQQAQQYDEFAFSADKDDGPSVSKKGKRKSTHPSAAPLDQATSTSRERVETSKRVLRSASAAAAVPQKPPLTPQPSVKRASSSKHPDNERVGPITSLRRSPRRTASPETKPVNEHASPVAPQRVSPHKTASSETKPVNEHVSPIAPLRRSPRRTASPEAKPVNEHASPFAPQLASPDKTTSSETKPVNEHVNPIAPQRISPHKTISPEAKPVHEHVSSIALRRTPRRKTTSPEPKPNEYHHSTKLQQYISSPKGSPPETKPAFSPRPIAPWDMLAAPPVDDLMATEAELVSRMRHLRGAVAEVQVPAVAYEPSPVTGDDVPWRTKLDDSGYRSGHPTVTKRSGERFGSASFQHEGKTVPFMSARRLDFDVVDESQPSPAYVESNRKRLFAETVRMDTVPAAAEQDIDDCHGFPSLHDPSIRSLLLALEDRLRRKAAQFQANSANIVAHRAEQLLHATGKIDKDRLRGVARVITCFRGDIERNHELREAVLRQALHGQQKFQVLSADYVEDGLKRRRTEEIRLQTTLNEIRSAYRAETRHLQRWRHNVLAHLQSK